MSVQDAIEQRVLNTFRGGFRCICSKIFHADRLADAWRRHRNTTDHNCVARAALACSQSRIPNCGASESAASSAQGSRNESVSKKQRTDEMRRTIALQVNAAVHAQVAASAAGEAACAGMAARFKACIGMLTHTRTQLSLAQQQLEAQQATVLRVVLQHHHEAQQGLLGTAEAVERGHAESLRVERVRAQELAERVLGIFEQAARYSTAIRNSEEQRNLAELSLSVERLCRCRAEAEWLASEAKHTAQVAAAQAYLAETCEVASSELSRLHRVLAQLQHFTAGLPESVMRICAAARDGHLSDFELTLLNDLGSKSAAPVHSALFIELTALIATGNGPSAAALLHGNFPKLFPSENTWRRRVRQSWRPLVFNRRLVGCDGNELARCMSAAREHFNGFNYRGPYTFAHDSTAVTPTANSRLVPGTNLLQLDMFVSGPVRVERSVAGALELKRLLASDDPKVCLATALVLIPFADPTGGIPPFTFGLVGGSGPDKAETVLWERAVRVAGQAASLPVWLTGADGAPGPRSYWLETFVVLWALQAGGKPERYLRPQLPLPASPPAVSSPPLPTHVPAAAELPAAVAATLPAGCRAVVVAFPGLIAFTACEERLLLTDGGDCILWRLLGPDDHHGDKKAHCAMHALQRSLVLGDYVVLLEHLLELAADPLYTKLHRNDLHHFDRQSWAVAARVFDIENVRRLRLSDQEDRDLGNPLRPPERLGTICYLDYMGGLLRATSKEPSLPISERLELSFAALFFMMYWRMYAAVDLWLLLIESDGL